jgi:hypothetical protein
MIKNSKKNVVSRSMRLRSFDNLNETFAALSTILSSSPSPQSYSSYYISIVDPFYSRLLCGGISYTEYGKTLIEYMDFGELLFPYDNPLWRCFQYRDNWNIKAIGDNLGPGFVFIYLENKYDCGDFKKKPPVGPGALAVLQTSKQINSYNDNPLRSISKMIIAYYNTINKSDVNQIDKNTWENIVKNNKLIFDDDYIYYIEPVELTFGDKITASYSQGFTSNIKIISLIGFIITGTNIPLSEFKFSSCRSSDNDVAKVDTTTIPFFGEIPVDTITLKQSGTFTLSGTQEFYQSQSSKVAYSKKDFSITINLTIY